MLYIYSSKDIETFVSPRAGEVKLGEKVETITNDTTITQALEDSNAKYVIIGVPEDIGVRMNYGNPGAHTAFIPALKALLNTQQNQFINGSEILVLGFLDYLADRDAFNSEDRNQGDTLVKAIDTEVSKWIQRIVTAGKIPIIIGGGHNNAYGALKGFSEAKESSVNAVNLDAHTDLRKLEERHSGNGFSYAFKNGYLDRYYMFGLHENYTPQYIFDTMNTQDNIGYTMFEDMMVYKSADFEKELEKAKNFVAESPFGIEVDLDCIQYFPSSAMSPSGFSPQEARRFVHFMATAKQASYIHICEGAPAVMNNPTAASQVGKFISYLITDFIKGKNS